MTQIRTRIRSPARPGATDVRPPQGRIRIPGRIPPAAPRDRSHRGVGSPARFSLCFANGLFLARAGSRPPDPVNATRKSANKSGAATSVYGDVAMPSNKLTTTSGWRRIISARSRATSSPAGKTLLSASRHSSLRQPVAWKSSWALGNRRIRTEATPAFPRTYQHGLRPTTAINCDNSRIARTPHVEPSSNYASQSLSAKSLLDQ